MLYKKKKQVNFCIYLIYYNCFVKKKGTIIQFLYGILVVTYRCCKFYKNKTNYYEDYFYFRNVIIGNLFLLHIAFNKQRKNIYNT